MYSRPLLIPILVTSLISGAVASGQTLTNATPLINRVINEADSISVPGNVHPLVAAATASTPADEATPMQHMVLSLKGTNTQEAQLAQLISNQHNPKSSQYRQYLTPQSYAAQFGAVQADISTVTTWLQSHGLTVEQVTANKRAIIFSGTAGQVADTFKTEIRQYTVSGVSHFANATDPKIPAALSSVVSGVVKLHDFRHANHIAKQTAVSEAQLAHPQYNTGGSGHYLSPADYSTIYDVSPLYSAGINGSGETVAILARSNIALSDVQTFRSTFGLKTNNPQIVITGTDPGIVAGDSAETTLDTEWAGALAPNANVKVIVSASTNTADGIDLAATYAVTNNVAPIVSLSYGSCEYDMGSSELSYYNGLWEEAASQGMSVIVSAGDNGAADCSSSSQYALAQSVNGLCSSGYATCVGGTEFVEGSNPGQFWLPGNNATYGSATSYIPEQVWNESALDGGSGSFATGGGQSINVVKPAYQVTFGVSVDDRRDVPDVALTAAMHDGYLIVQNGNVSAVAGTSAAAPAFAGMMALVDQKVGSKQGLANLNLYPLATLQAAGGAAIFHDITVGNNSVPNVTGFSASTSYDRVTGLGSIDAALMVNHWTDASVSNLSVSGSTSVLTVGLGQTGKVNMLTVGSALTGPIALSMSGLPQGVTGGFATPTVASPGTGSDLLTLNVLSSATPGTYPITVTANAGSVSATANVSLIVPQPNFTIATLNSFATLTVGSPSKVDVIVTPTNGLSSNIALTVQGMPAGVTGTYSPATVSGTTGGTSVLTLSTTSNAIPGTYTITLIGTSGGITKSTALTVYVVIAPACSMSSNPASISLLAGSSLGVQLSCKQLTGTFTGALNLTVNLNTAGVSEHLSSGYLMPGQTVTMNLASTLAAVAGTSKIAVTATAGNYSQTLTIPLTITTQ